MRFWLNSIFGVLLSLSIGISYAADREALFSFASQVSQHMLAQHFHELSSLHHYPGQMNAAFAYEDACMVEHNLRDLVKGFGELQSLRPLRGRAMFMGLGSGNGNAEYWSQQPGAYTFTYEAEFKKAGSGIIKLEVVDFTEKPRLKAIHFGLSASEESILTLQEIALDVTEAREAREKSHVCRSVIQS